jgi:hypothetical protein
MAPARKTLKPVSLKAGKANGAPTTSEAKSNKKAAPKTTPASAENTKPDGKPKRI